MKIGYITQWFPPEPAAVSYGIAEGLAGRGHEIHVITGFPNYPSGTVYPGYRQKLHAVEETGGMTVHRLPLIANHGQSAIPRFANYSSFALTASAFLASSSPKPDVWLTYSSPALAGLAPLTSSGGRGAPRTLILQDLWPESVTESTILSPWLRPLVKKSVGAISNLTYRDASRIGIISPGMRQILESRGVESRRIHYTPNWITEPKINALQDVASQRAELGLPSGLLFVYAGNVGDFQGVESLVNAFAQHPAVCLAIIGDGTRARAVREKIDKGNIKNVVYRSRVNSEMIAKYLASADVHVVSLVETPLMRATMPSKVQTSLAHSRPVLVNAAGDVADLIAGSGSGMAVRHGDLRALSLAIERFAQMTPRERLEMGRVGRALYDREFILPKGIDRVEKMLFDAVSDPLASKD